MKKFLVIFLSIFLVVGCSFGNTPTKKAEDTLKKYQNLDDSVLKDLELVVEGTTLNTERKKWLHKSNENAIQWPKIQNH